MDTKVETPQVRDKDWIHKGPGKSDPAHKGLLCELELADVQHNTSAATGWTDQQQSLL